MRGPHRTRAPNLSEIAAEALHNGHSALLLDPQVGASKSRSDGIAIGIASSQPAISVGWAWTSAIATRAASTQRRTLAETVSIMQPVSITGHADERRVQRARLFW